MATIEKYVKSTDPDRAYYLVRYRKPNHRQTTRRGFRTKKAAEAFAASVETSISAGTYIDPARGRVTIGELGDSWLKRQGHLKPSSLRPIEIAWRVHVEPRWGRTRVCDVFHTDVQQWVSDLGERRSGTTVQRAYGVLSSILADAVRDSRILTNPADGVKGKRKVANEHVYLSHDQVRLLADAAGDHELVVLVLAYTGLRWGEMAALRVRDVDTERRRLAVNQNAVEVGAEVIVGTPKTHARRSVPYPKIIQAKMLNAIDGKGSDDLVFPGHDGGYMRRTRTDKGSTGWFAGAVRRSGLPRVTPHQLRHTAASLAVQAGANVKVVQRMLGHKSAVMTLDRYADLFDDDLDEVADAMDAAARRNHDRS